MAKFVTPEEIAEYAAKNPSLPALAPVVCEKKILVQYQCVGTGDCVIVVGSDGSKEIYSQEKFTELFNVA